MSFSGFWHISDMEMWDNDYLNMETQAYIRIEENGLGDFQFGLVVASLDGEVVTDRGSDRFEFTWDGSDEMDPVSGSGWLQFIDDMTLTGRIKIHLGDSSMLSATRVK